MSNDKRTHRNLSEDEIREYLLGKRKGKTAHAVERHLLHDEFDRQAMEGYAAFEGGPLHDIRTLRKRLGSPQKAIRSQWFSVAAAAAVVLVGSCIVWYRFNLETHQHNQNQALAVRSKKNKNTPKSLEADQEKQPEEIASQAMQQEQNALVADGDYATVDWDTMLQHDNAALAVGTPEVEEGTLAKHSVGREPEHQETEEVADLFESRPTWSRAKENKSIQDQGEDEADIAVEVDIATFRKGERLAYSAARGKRVEYQEAQPMHGLAAYTTYLAQSLRYPAKAKAAGIAGTVVLQLTLSALGEIQDIRVKHSLGYGCDEEAIRLVNEGPSWVSAKKEGKPVEGMVQITVKFVLE